MLEKSNKFEKYRTTFYEQWDTVVVYSTYL